MKEVCLLDGGVILDEDISDGAVESRIAVVKEAARRGRSFANKQQLDFSRTKLFPHSLPIWR